MSTVNHLSMNAHLKEDKIRALNKKDWECYVIIASATTCGKKF